MGEENKVFKKEQYNVQDAHSGKDPFWLDQRPAILVASALPPLTTLVDTKRGTKLQYLELASPNVWIHDIQLHR